MDDELKALKRNRSPFNFLVEDCKRYFGMWDGIDPVCWAILRVVQAQNDMAYAVEQDVCYVADGKDAVEAAIEERRQAIAALQQALAREPRGFQ